MYCPQSPLGSGERIELLQRRYALEVAPQRPQGVAFAGYLLGAPKTHAAEDRHRGTPALHSVLEQEREHEARHDEPPAVVHDSEHETRQPESRGVQFERPLYVPFPIELLYPPLDLELVLPRGLPHAFLYATIYPLVDGWRAFLADPVCRFA